MLNLINVNQFKGKHLTHKIVLNVQTLLMNLYNTFITCYKNSTQTYYQEQLSYNKIFIKYLYV